MHYSIAMPASSYTVRVRYLFVTALTFVLGACATLPKNPPLGPPGHARSPANAGALADLETYLRSKMAEPVSGFKLVEANGEGLRWRLALIDSAQSSLDMQYYF